MDLILFCAIYLACLFVPGLAVQRLLNLNAPHFLVGLSLSVCLFAIAFLVGNYWRISATVITVYMASITLLSAAYLIFGNRNLCSESKRSVRQAAASPVIVIAALSAIYQLVFGSFTEVPSDLYAHMERVQTAITSTENDTLGLALSWKYLLLQRSGVSYYFLAIVNNIYEVSPDTLVIAVDYSNRTIFLIASYFFSLQIFCAHSNRKLIAAMATVFVALHMGINVFAYVRYYTLAPTILNMVLYMAAVTLFLKAVREPISFRVIGLYLLITIITLVASSVHIQEAMFIGIMIAIMSAIGLLSLLKLSKTNVKINAPQVFILSALALSGFIAIYLYSSFNMERALNAHWRLWDFGVRLPLLPDLTVINLKLEFSQVITLWGGLVYLLFFLNIKRYSSNLFVLAGMLSPLFTILNPFFVDVFMRHYNSTTLWRLAYIIPIHYVAADLFVYYCNCARNSHWPARAVKTGVPLMLVALLLPWKNTWQGLHFSRLPTLGASDPALSYSYYDDLLDYLQVQDKKYYILTDPMTGYMVSAMTKHTSSRKKFFRDYRFRDFTFADYSDDPLKKYKGYLLIVNQRQHPISDVATLSGHWRGDEWQQKHHYYSQALTRHIADSGDQSYELLWGNKGVSVYLIK